MIDHVTLGTYLAVLIGFVFIPGPAVVLTLTQALSSGTRVGIATGLGIAVGDLVHTAMAVFGLSAVLLGSALLFELVKYVGAAYLVYLGIRAILARDSGTVLQRAKPMSSARAFRQAVLAEMLNPKSALFFLAFLPQFVSTSEPHPVPQMIELSVVFMLMTFVVFVGYGLFAASIRDHVITRPRVLTWMRRTFAAAFVGLGIKLALADR